MGGLLVSLALSGLGRDAIRVALGLAVAVLLAAAFVTSALAALVTAALNPAALVVAGGASLVAPTATEARRSVRFASSARAAPTVFGAVPAGTAAQALRAARTAISTPYVWGGADPRTGVDCSGLVQWAYRQAGIALPRTAQAQFDATLPVRTEELRPGDLVFFGICCQPPDVVTHVGVYVGHGQMLHAPAPGEYVRIESLDTPYWRSHWAGARRADYIQ